MPLSHVSYFSQLRTEKLVLNQLSRAHSVKTFALCNRSRKDWRKKNKSGHVKCFRFLGSIHTFLGTSTAQSWINISDPGAPAVHFEGTLDFYITKYKKGVFEAYCILLLVTITGIPKIKNMDKTILPCILQQQISPSWWQPVICNKILLN